MPFPKAIFIDTCVIESQQFNFASTQLAALAKAVTGKDLKLLLPHATKLEIARHIREAAQTSVATLKKARKERPVLLRLGLPATSADFDKAKRHLEDAISAEWQDFCAKFELVELDYSGVNPKEVMEWYDRQQAPFGTGDKRKEFPDAFAFASLLAYATENNELVAVVSSDNDFKSACGGRKLLKHFSSAHELTTAFLENEAHIKAAEALLKGAGGLICAKISVAFPELGFDHADDPNGFGEVDDVEVSDSDVVEAAVIDVEAAEFTAYFAARVHYSAYVDYDDPDSMIVDSSEDVFMPLHKRRGEVDEECTIEGSVTFEVSEDWTTILQITAFKIENDLIEVTEKAPISDDPEDDDDAT